MPALLAAVAGFLFSGAAFLYAVALFTDVSRAH